MDYINLQLSISIFFSDKPKQLEKFSQRPLEPGGDESHHPRHPSDARQPRHPLIDMGFRRERCLDAIAQSTSLQQATEYLLEDNVLQAIAMSLEDNVLTVQLSDAATAAAACTSAAPSSSSSAAAATAPKAMPSTFTKPTKKEDTKPPEQEDPRPVVRGRAERLLEPAGRAAADGVRCVRTAQHQRRAQRPCSHAHSEDRNTLAEENVLAEDNGLAEECLRRQECSR